jgi:diguanylate cyclase (GGDEF)-like protein
VVDTPTAPKNMLAAFFDRLEPPLGAMEAEYRLQYLSADVVQTRTFWLAVASLKLVLLVFHLFSTTRDATYYLWVADDLVVSTLLFAVALSLGRVRLPARYDKVVAVVTLALILDNWMFAVTGPKTDFTQFTFDILLVICCYLVVPAPLPLRAAFATLITALALGVLFLLRLPSPIYSTSIPTLLLGTYVLGLLISARIYTYRRQQYRATRETAGLNEQLTVLAETDALTGVFNRRKIMELGGEEFARFKRYGQPFSIALMDIDHFKQVNDKFGHAAGDEVLRRVAQTIVEGKRAVDHAGRLGGEEFGLLLPATPAAAAVTVVDRIRQRLSDKPTPAEAQAEQPAISVALSAGVSEIGPGDASIEDALRRVDELLYRAKQRGRNRVEA